MKTVELERTQIFDPFLNLIMFMKNYLKISYIIFFIGRRMFSLLKLIFEG